MWLQLRLLPYSWSSGGDRCGPCRPLAFTTDRGNPVAVRLRRRVFSCPACRLAAQDAARPSGMRDAGSNPAGQGFGRGGPLHPDPLVARRADLPVRAGANVQPGRPVLVMADIAHAEIVRAVVERAYAAGASLVQ